MHPTVAIVGRPNVGKSSLFNRLVGKPNSIVDPTPGVTRDRVFYTAEPEPWRFDLVDTGGIGIVDEAKLEQDVYRQVERAIDAADRVVFLVDGREGVHPVDREIAAKLRPLAGRVVVAVNKLDYDGLDNESYQFLSLGLGDPLGISAAAGRGIEELCQRLFHDLPSARATGPATRLPSQDGKIRICLAGRRNVGKSSLTNALCGEERMIVADYAGTTRDAVDVPLTTKHGEFVLIDTAGLRRKNQIEQDLEFYAACRTERAIKRADVVLLVLDAGDEVGNVDKKLAHFCEVEGKPTVIVVNKWDIAEAGGASRDEYLKWLRDRLPGLKFAPVTFTCALTGYNIDDALRLAVELHAESQARVTTSEVNDLLAAALQRRRPKRGNGGSTRIYFATQAETDPPTFIFFVNRTDWLEPGYGRFLENFLRERLPFKRIPLRLKFKSRESKFHGVTDKHRVITAKTKAGRTANLIIPKQDRPRKFRPRRDSQPEDGAADPE